VARTRRASRSARSPAGLGAAALAIVVTHEAEGRALGLGERSAATRPSIRAGSLAARAAPRRSGGRGDRGIDELREDEAEGEQIARARVAEIAVARGEVAKRGALGGALVEGAREAEVEHVDRALRVDEEVVGLDVAVREAEGVEVGEGLARVARDGEGEGAAIVRGRAGERETFDPAEREEGARVGRRRGAARGEGVEGVAGEGAPAEVEQLGEARGEGERGFAGLAREGLGAAGLVGDFERDEGAVVVASRAMYLGRAPRAGSAEEREGGRQLVWQLPQIGHAP
jgi:hypothetical protein